MALDIYSKIETYEQFLIDYWEYNKANCNIELSNYYRYQYILLHHNMEYSKVGREGSYRVPEALEGTYLEWWSADRLNKRKMEIQ